MAEPSSFELPSLHGGIGPLNDIDSRLAFELAIDMSEPADVLARYDISKEELKAKVSNPHFRKMVKEYKALWNSDLSVKERIRFKTMMLVEDSLIELHRIFHDPNLAVNARMDAFKSMAKVATVDAPDKEGQSAGERINISINIPGAEKPITFEGVAEAVGENSGGKAITNGS